MLCYVVKLEKLEVMKMENKTFEELLTELEQIVSELEETN